MQIAHKFGGTSMADAGCIARVADLLLARPEAGQSIVVSAMRGVTDALEGWRRSLLEPVLTPLLG